LEGLRENPHEASAWVNVAVWPPAVNVAVRVEPVLSADTATPTTPIPAPDAPLTTVAQLESLENIHAHPDGARML
jgi:hypothetical protein